MTSVQKNKNFEIYVKSERSAFGTKTFAVVQKNYNSF